MSNCRFTISRSSTNQINTADKLLTGLKDSDIAHSAELKKLDAAVEEIKLKRWQKNQAISTQKTRQFENQRRIDRAESDLSHLATRSNGFPWKSPGWNRSSQSLEEKNQGILTEISQAEQEIVQTRPDGHGGGGG